MSRFLLAGWNNADGKNPREMIFLQKGVEIPPRALVIWLNQ
jgi:hypothetical protein